jgi:hypothetical protein
MTLAKEGSSIEQTRSIFLWSAAMIWWCGRGQLSGPFNLFISAKVSIYKLTTGPRQSISGPEKGTNYQKKYDSIYGTR